MNTVCPKCLARLQPDQTVLLSNSTGQSLRPVE